MSEAIQITIPDFDDDDVRSGPTTFGRSGFGFGFGNAGGGFGSGAGAGFGSGLDSPVATPLASVGERSYFSHTRGDSSTSVDSTGSGTPRFPSKPSAPFAHSANSSITATTGFTKKPSFASIRNAFKSTKNNNDAPPVPQLDQAYPVLKNPFNRSTSSLSYAPPMGTRTANGSFTSGASSPFPRPPTPVSSTQTRSKSKGHAYTKSQHSHTGSVFHASDAGSDYGGPSYSSSPPPVPRVPVFGHIQHSEYSLPDLEEDNIIMDPKTASDYALHAVFIRFAASAESKINIFLKQSLESEPLLPTFMGPGVDAKFDALLSALGKVAKKHAKSVIDSVMRWRRTQNENVGSDIIGLHTPKVATTNRNIRPHDIPGLLNARKSLASIYLMCRALIAILQSVSKDALGDTIGYSLEETTFEQFRQPDLKLLSLSENHRINEELYATLLGHLANIRFISVTDRFLAELGPVAQGQVPKDLDMKYENLVKGLRHIQLKVWPPEAFEEGAEFMESLSKSFVNAHGLQLKIAFAETLVQILHPIGKTAQAETNNPQWAKAIETIHPKAREMTTKLRYWHVAFPLTITCLCVAPQIDFLKWWIPCFEGTVAKLKEKPYRVSIMNGFLRMIWTYLYRCQESATTTTTKLDVILKHFFPPNKIGVFPQEKNLDPFVYIVHFVLSRHFEYGRDLCLELMQESAISSFQKSGNIGTLLAPERTAIATQAILLSLSLLEREGTMPAWPSNHDFTVYPSREDYPISADSLPATLLAKSGIHDLFERCSWTLATIALFCNNAIGHMYLLDEQWLHSRLNLTFEESSSFVVRHHPEGTVVAYPNHCLPHVSLLQTCFRSWPRCLHSSMLPADAIDMVLRGVVHVDPSLADVASITLNRFAKDPFYVLTVVARFTSFLFGPARTTQEVFEVFGVRIIVELPRLLDLWVSIIDGWIQHISCMDSEALAEEHDTIFSKCVDVEAASLFLMSHETLFARAAGVKVIRLLGILLLNVAKKNTNDFKTPLHIVQSLHEKTTSQKYLAGYSDLLEETELSRLEQWRQSDKVDVLLRIADSNHDKDRKLWRYILPSFLQGSMHYAASLAPFREIAIAAVSRYHPTIAHLAGLSSRFPIGLPNRTQTISERNGIKIVKDNAMVINQWHIWIKLLCSTATYPDHSRTGREHSRAPSDANFERERLSSTRGLFRYLTPFLDSEYTPFRDAAVLCISSFPSASYPQLLDDLNLLAGRQFYDESRSKLGPVANSDQGNLAGGSRQFQVQEDPKSKPALSMVSIQLDRGRRQERLHSAVARIYFLTANLLQHQRSAGRQAALANVLKFIRNTQAFLSAPEARENYNLQRLRRYFSGTVERIFDGLASLKDSDRFIPPNMHLTLYRLCEEWCQLGYQPDAVKTRYELMEKMVGASDSGSDSSQLLERFKHETLLLSQASIGALASLCHKALFPPNMAANSPTERPPLEYLKPLTVRSVLDRLGAILSSSHQATQLRGRKALKTLLTCAWPEFESNSSADILKTKELYLEISRESLKRAVVVGDSSSSSNQLFFEVMSEVVCKDTHSFSFSEVVCLGLANLCHSALRVRTMAFNMLEAIHQQSSGLLAMSTFECTVCSSAAGVYTHAHRLIADFLAGEHPHQATRILAQLGIFLPQIPTNASSPNVVLLLLQSLEFWLPNINLMTEDKTTLSREGLSSLYYLLSLTLRYSISHPEQILVMWTKLVDPPNQSNGHAAVRFLLEQSHKVGSTAFVTCAAHIVSCLCQTHIGKGIFEDLCSVIEPARMLPTIDHKLALPPEGDMELWADLDALFAEQPRLNLSSAQYAWLFLTDVALQRCWDMGRQLPVLLHSLFAHMDHRSSFVRSRAQHMLFQLLRSWMPGYDELAERSAHPSWAALKRDIVELEDAARGNYWTEEDARAEAEPKMAFLCSRVTKLFEALAPRLTDEWGALSLIWGTECSIRTIAFRSMQLFRALMPRIKMSEFSKLLGRLSNTISGSDENIQAFTAEIILTIKAIITMDDPDPTFFPQTFWCICASLSTTVEDEFVHILSLLEALLSRIDLDDPRITELLLSQRPIDWRGSPYLQPVLLRGLRSSRTSGTTMNILQRLSKIQDNRLIDASDGRVRDLCTVALPWCLQAMDAKDDSLATFAGSIAQLAQQENRHSIFKIMMSFSRSHFRTRDDFLRQSVSSLREHYGSRHWMDIVTLLLGLVLNNERWLRIQAMQSLKLLFQQREARSATEPFGSELLMPLLRLLDTDLASCALDVLEEPVVMFGGPSAKHILRMSMHGGTMPVISDSESVVVVFGVPTESGWGVGQVDVSRENCRANTAAVFDTCNSLPSRPSRIDFEPEVEALASIDRNGGDDLGGIVKNLHDLNSFFKEVDTLTGAPLLSIPDRRLEARVAAILAKSTASETVANVPQTPFLDVFHVGGSNISEDSDTHSDSDSDLDAFAFDLPLHS